MPFPKFPALAQNRTLTLSRGASRELPVTARSPDHLSALTCSSELGTPLEMENMGTLFLPLPPLQLPAAPLSWLYTPYIFENRRKEHFFTFAIYFEKFKWRMMWSCNIPLFFFPLSVHTTRRDLSAKYWKYTRQKQRKMISPFPQSRWVWRHELLHVTPSQLHRGVTSTRDTKEMSYFVKLLWVKAPMHLLSQHQGWGVLYHSRNAAAVRPTNAAQSAGRLRVQVCKHLDSKLLISNTKWAFSNTISVVSLIARNTINTWISLVFQSHIWHQNCQKMLQKLRWLIH